MLKRKNSKFEKGFALIVTLLLLMLVTGLAVSVMFLASTQKQISGSDSETSVAYYGAEAGMEKMMVDLGNLYQTKQTPTLADLASLDTLFPTGTVLPDISFSDPNVVNPYNVTATPDSTGTYPASYTSTVASGADQGLVAQIIPINLAVAARTPSGTEVRMFRKVEVALIPVFQFGVFCDADCSYYPGPDFNFAGRVHTNGNLWLGTQATTPGLVFHDKVSAYGNVIRQQLANTFPTPGTYTGDVYAPTAANGCGVYPATTGPACSALGLAEGSVTGGNVCNPPNSAPNCDTSSTTNPNWFTNGVAGGISGAGGRYGSYLLSGVDGASKLTLPFVTQGVLPIEIIRRAQASDSTALASSRLDNEAAIRILLDDNPYNLSAAGPADPDNIPLAAVSTGGKIAGTSSWTGASGNYYFATGTNANNLVNTGTVLAPTYGPDPNWVVPSTAAGLTKNPGGTAPTGVVDPYTYITGSKPDSGDGSSTVKYPETYLNSGGKAPNTTDWPLLSGWLRVEIETKVGGTPTAVTREWLALGFTRQFNQFPNSETGVKNTVYPNAIILLQQQMNPNRTKAGDIFNPAYASIDTHGYDLLPINMYDPREGELRDNSSTDDSTKAAGSCSLNGLMNVTEIDIGNLNKWLTTSTTGKTVDGTSYNGYILYFSDRRGGSLDGGYDYLDTTNTTNSLTVTSSPTWSAQVTRGYPDGILSAEEDVYQGQYNTAIGGSAAPTTTLITPPKYIGSAFGFGQITAINPGVGQRIATCATTGEWNMVLAPRHVLRLVDGTLGNLPMSPAKTGGFTVASEQPVYVVGNYNASAATGLPQSTTTYSAASVIADAVTLLSTAYNDQGTLSTPFTPDTAATSYYRLAIASGKTLTFKLPPSQLSTHNDFGTDGGIHNFLRYIENWGGSNLYYEGSMVSLYYSAYATGAFKCCTTVYSPPARNYSFDTNFLTPSLLPPGTPEFKDVVDLGFQQDLNP